MRQPCSLYLLTLVVLLSSLIGLVQFGDASESPEPQRNQTELYFDFSTAERWSVDETIKWIEEELGSSLFSEAFRKEKIDGELLLELDDQALKEVFNITKPYQRKKIMRAITKMKQYHTVPLDAHDFWTYRTQNTRKANVLYVWLIQLPRLTILYEYIFHPEDVEAIVGSELSWWFWFTWLVFPHSLCSYYALPYWQNNFVVTTLFIYGSMYYQMTELLSLFAHDAVKLDRTIILKRSVFAPICALGFNYLSRWLGTFHFCFYLGVLVIFFFDALQKHLKKECGKPNQIQRPEDAVFPPALKIDSKDLDADSVPAHFLCPITRCIMTQPAITDHGNTYELPAIREWLKKNRKDPLTNKPLNIIELKPNRILHSMIEEWVEQRSAKPKED